MIPTVRLVLEAKLPQRGSADAAGLDLFTLSDFSLGPGKRLLVPTGIAMAFQHGTYGRIAPRSKLANKFGIDVLAGVIDADYRGQIHVILLNTGHDWFHAEAGDAIAQIIHETCLMGNCLEVHHLPDTERGHEGINSQEFRRSGATVV